jgi:hypothetical protein
MQYIFTLIHVLLFFSIFFFIIVYYRTTCVVESASFYMLMLSTSVHLSNSKWLSLFSGGLFLVTGQVNRQGSLYSKKKKTKEIKKKKKKCTLKENRVIFQYHFHLFFTLDSKNRD